MACPKKILGDLHLGLLNLASLLNTEEEMAKLNELETGLFEMRKILEKKYDINLCVVRQFDEPGL